jgi:hypothetical protein
MSDPIDPMLSGHLDAWRESSRRAPRWHARDGALDANGNGARLCRCRVSDSLAFFRATIPVCGAGSRTGDARSNCRRGCGRRNAPPGSALFVVRAARQGLMLRLPGSDDAVLHLRFAEQSLTEARDRIDPEQSLANARAEL